MRNPISISLFLLLAAGSAVSCGHRETADNVAQVHASDSLPAAVKHLVKAVADGDKQSFASLVSYPVLRPYPLHDIPDSAAMLNYYDTLVDDSLRSVLTQAPPQAWEQYGWRGWSVDGGQYVWVDEAVYSIDYTSAAERANRQSLVKKEMESLVPELRAGWEPVACMRAVNSGRVMRIDEKTDDDGQPVYRLAIYTSPAAMRGKPEALFTGYMEAEGTAQIISYNFTGPSGVSATYMPEAADGSDPVVDFSVPGKPDVTVTVQPAYWLDLLPA